MKDKYIIINKLTLEKRIEELETKKLQNPYSAYHTQPLQVEINTLKQILSQSTPLIPEIEKAIEYGMLEGSGAELSEITDEVTEHQQDYISNLKLDI